MLARAYRLIADAALHASRYEEARANYEEAIRRLDQLGSDEEAAITRALYVTLLLQLGRRPAAKRHAESLRAYLARAPADWSYHQEAEQAVRLYEQAGEESRS